MGKGKTGRPTSFTEETREAILRHLRLGLRYADAARAAGVAPSTFREWRKKGKDGQEGFAAFLAEIKAAQGECQATLLGRIHKAAEEGTWTAAAWILERRHPDKWGRRTSIDKTVTHKSKGGMTVGEQARMVLENQALRMQLTAIFQAVGQQQEESGGKTIH